MATDTTQPTDRRRWIVLAALCLTVLLVVAANMALTVALPILGSRLHAGITSLQWIVDIYVLCFAALLLPAGALGDRLGRKTTLQLAHGPHAALLHAARDAYTGGMQLALWIGSAVVLTVAVAVWWLMPTSRARSSTHQPADNAVPTAPFRQAPANTRR